MNDSESIGPDQAVAAAWAEFTQRLAAYIAGMYDELDHLVLEAPAGSAVAGATPFVQFCGAGDGLVRAELAGNAVLTKKFELGDEQVADLILAGWGEPAGNCPNFSLLLETSDAEILATMAANGLEHTFGLPHPSLLTARAWGPGAALVPVLGLTLAEDVPDDIVPSGGPAWNAALSVQSHDHLIELTREWLAATSDPAPEQDHDGDFVIETGKWPVYLRVRSDQPVIEVFGAVVARVRTRRQAAIEVSILNRRHPLTKFTLIDDTIWQFMPLPAMPFVPAHLAGMLPVFRETLDEVRDDLALRTGGKPTT